MAIFNVISTVVVLVASLRTQDMFPQRPHLQIQNPVHNKGAGFHHDLRVPPVTVDENHGLAYPFTLKTETQDLVHWFMHELKSNFDEAHVNVVRFEAQRENLSKGLADMESMVLCIAPYDWHLNTQVNFVKSVFHRLAKFVDTFGIYRSFYDTPRNLVYRMAELGAALGGLHDTSGNLDTSQRGYIDKLYYMWDSVTLWSNQFEMFSGLPENVRTQFYHHKAFAEKEIQDLWTQV